MRGPIYRSVTGVALLLLLSACSSPPDGLTEDIAARMRTTATASSERWVEIRRTIHQHPELSSEEVQTARLIADELRALGLEVEEGVGGTGVVGVLRGGRPGSIVAYRADMDAVRSPVVGDVPYRSQVAGVKHVCGHDAHVAVGIGVAELLASVRDRLPGTVRFLFQPAEETVSGAQKMIDNGALGEPAPGAIFAIHTTPYPVGTIGVPLDAGFTGWDIFQITLDSDGDPRQVTREVLDVIVALSTVEPIEAPEDMARMMAEMRIENGPLTDFLWVAASDATPVDAPSGRRILRGQVRAAGDAAYARGRALVSEAVVQITEGRARFKVEFGQTRFPDMHSDEALSRAAVAPIETFAGAGSTFYVHGSAPFFGEDFARFQEHVTGAMFFLGVANPAEGITAYNHFPDYDIDESAIGIGAQAMAGVLFDHLARNP